MMPLRTVIHLPTNRLTRSVLILLVYSDHALVTCRLSITVGHAATAERLERGWCQVDRDVLRRALKDSPLRQPVADDADVDDLFAEYKAVLRDVADRLTLLHVIRRPAGRPAPWFNASCSKARHHCRRLKRHYHSTCRADDRRRWVDAARCRFRLYWAKKEAYWMYRLTQQVRSSPQLWRSLSTMLGFLGRDRETSGTTGHTADGFAEFFSHKVDRHDVCRAQVV